MKKFIASIISLAVVIAIAIDGYFIFFKQKLTGTSTAAAVQDSASKTTSAPSHDASTKASDSSAASASSKYHDGTFTGKATATEWGDVQVQATISKGRMTNINVLKYPTDHNDKAFNQRVLPIYKSEAIKAQSAKISLVSGASETYKGFKGSLQNALLQAEE